WSDVCVVRYEWLLGRDGEARRDYCGKKKEEIDYRSFSDNAQLSEFLVCLANRPADLFSCSLTSVKNGQAEIDILMRLWNDVGCYHLTDSSPGRSTGIH